uniref:EamA domain-containing protein n=1 Tax=Chromera velia CCMP2878 TaxID=1169474 RepID=A0A0G4HGM5_9ALVE|eukprot:Cvel_27281.t1-p1 / transcript=Cvel_27281.t1 / gene=Cvel_27281 / organism=Chromera_velia_CCMP2878 / gene_product=hypothetical protein / transcript_product=hypothetical protein / location=Cvel_scaffold3379:10459-16608(-) / protein_length=884 / sequence_SO=supercontig / SO=protein_coding / is_pseudo=false
MRTVSSKAAAVAAAAVLVSNSAGLVSAFSSSPSPALKTTAPFPSRSFKRSRRASPQHREAKASRPRDLLSLSPAKGSPLNSGNQNASFPSERRLTEERPLHETEEDDGSGKVETRSSSSSSRSFINEEKVSRQRLGGGADVFEEIERRGESAHRVFVPFDSIDVAGLLDAGEVRKEKDEEHLEIQSESHFKARLQTQPRPSSYASSSLSPSSRSFANAQGPSHVSATLMAAETAREGEAGAVGVTEREDGERGALSVPISLSADANGIGAATNAGEREETAQGQGGHMARETKAQGTEEKEQEKEGELFSPSWLFPRLATVLMAVTTGTNFGSIKFMQDTLPPSVAAAARFSVAALVIAPWVLKARLEVVGLGILGGIPVAIGYITQALGLNLSSADEAAFLCSLVVVFTPLLEAGLTGKKFKSHSVQAAVVALLGVALLTQKSLTLPDPSSFSLSSLTDAFVHLQEGKAQLGEETVGSGFGLPLPVSLSIGAGTLLNLVQAVGFSGGYVVAEEAMKRYPEEAVPYSGVTLWVTALAALVWAGGDLWGLGGVRESLEGLGVQSVREAVETGGFAFGDILAHKEALLAVFYTGAIATALTVIVETVVLKYLGAGEMALILASEPLWAALFAGWLLGEAMGAKDIAGGALILSACVYGQMMALKEPGEQEEEEEEEEEHEEGRMKEREETRTDNYQSSSSQLVGVMKSGMRLRRAPLRLLLSASGSESRRRGKGQGERKEKDQLVGVASAAALSSVARPALFFSGAADFVDVAASSSADGAGVSASASSYEAMAASALEKVGQEAVRAAESLSESTGGGAKLVPLAEKATKIGGVAVPSLMEKAASLGDAGIDTAERVSELSPALMDKMGRKIELASEVLQRIRGY